MATPSLSYSVRDRSILLPFYKRFLVEPLLPVIPRRLSPNAITHGGHLVNLLALLLLAYAAPRMDSGWPFFAVPVLVQFWLWCDHADGGHARRTNQCSAMGEFLDHGLDLLNATYVVCMTVLTLGTPSFWSVTAAVAVPAAAAVTYWEQAETGVFQLGLLNQIESVSCLTLALIVRGVVGGSVMNGVHIGTLPLPVAILIFVSTVALFGMLRSAVRVGQFQARAQEKGRLVPFAAPLVFGAALTLAAATGALGTLSAIVVGAVVYVFIGIRQLTFRVRGERPRLELGVIAAALLLVGVAVHHMRGGEAGGAVEWSVAGVIAVAFGALAVAHALEGHRQVGRLDAGK